MNTAWPCRWKHVVSRAADALPPPRPGPEPHDDGAEHSGGFAGPRRQLQHPRRAQGPHFPPRAPALVAREETAARPLPPDRLEERAGLPLVYAHLAGLGITAGAHRLWAHRSYKATWPLRFFLMICQTIAFQNHIYEWVRDHRVHHKYTDTDADPHNSRRGFFFSHMGWLMLRKHPHVRERGQKLDMSDLEADSIVMWQRRYYIPLMVMWCFGIPSWIPSFFWGEQLYVAYYVTLARYTFQLHATWLVNSAAHIWGMRPYDKNISPTQNLGVAIVSLGEGWHNYHHVFPWDYKTAELGNYGTNMTAGFIDCCAKLGLAYNLKSVANEYIRRRAQRTGDGSHTHGGVWGWGDKDTSKEDIAAVHISHHKES
ncbi:Acyl-CoA Delta(11) desaturase [Gryllus bimaculatus]|nr:Acyl-CoA Delta(11) desaturase [Gryllus bimaculatus]